MPDLRRYRRRCRATATGGADLPGVSRTCCSQRRARGYGGALTGWHASVEVDPRESLSHPRRRRAERRTSTTLGRPAAPTAAPVLSPRDPARSDVYDGSRGAAGRGVRSAIESAGLLSSPRRGRTMSAPSARPALARVHWRGARVVSPAGNLARPRCGDTGARHSSSSRERVGSVEGVQNALVELLGGMTLSDLRAVRRYSTEPGSSSDDLKPTRMACFASVFGHRRAATASRTAVLVPARRAEGSARRSGCSATRSGRAGRRRSRATGTSTAAVARQFSPKARLARATAALRGPLRGDPRRGARPASSGTATCTTRKAPRSTPLVQNLLLAACAARTTAGRSRVGTHSSSPSFRAAARDPRLASRLERDDHARQAPGPSPGPCGAARSESCVYDDIWGWRRVVGRRPARRVALHVRPVRPSVSRASRRGRRTARASPRGSCSREDRRLTRLEAVVERGGR